MDLLDRIAYDSEGYTVQEILSSFCKKILEIIDLVNKNEEVCNEANTILENIRNEVIPDLVDDIMKEMQDNGYFDNLVNDTLIEQLRTELTTLLNQTITDYTTRLDGKANEGIERWINHSNDDKSIYIAGDSTSDETIPYNGNSPTKCLYDRLQRVGVGEGYPLEGVAIRNGYGTSGCTAKDYLNGTGPATDRNLNKLLNALRTDDRKYKLVILSLGLNNSGDDTFVSKYDSMTKIIEKILEIDDTFILLRMPNSIADTDDLTHSNLMRDLYIALDNDKHPRTSMLNTQKLLWGEQAGFIPTRGYYTNNNYPQWCVIVEGGKAWKPTTYGTSGSVKPNFAQGNKGDTLADGTVVWTCLGKGTDLFLNPYHPSQKGFEKLADLLIEVLTDKSKIDDKFKSNIYENYVDTNPLFDVYKDTFIVSGEYEGIINKIEKGDIIQVGNNFSELGEIKGVYNPIYHNTSINNIDYGQYVFINGYTWRCIYYGTADFANFPTLDDSVNINKTVFANGNAIFALECKGKMIEVDADNVTSGNTIIGAYRKRLRIYKKKANNIGKYKIYKGIVKSGNAEIDKMFTDAGFTIEIKTDFAAKENICLGFATGQGFYLYKDNTNPNSISKLFNYTNGYHTIEQAGWSDVNFEAQFYIKDHTKIDTSKLTSRYTFSNNTFVKEIGKEKTIEEHLRYLYTIS